MGLELPSLEVGAIDCVAFLLEGMSADVRRDRIALLTMEAIERQAIATENLRLEQFRANHLRSAQIQMGLKTMEADATFKAEIEDHLDLRKTWNVYREMKKWEDDEEETEEKGKEDEEMDQS